MQYDEIEDAYVTRLAPLAEYGFAIQAMPDSKAEISRPAVRSRVTVAFASSRFGDKTAPGTPQLLSLGVPHTEEFIEFSVVIQANRKAGRAGLYQGLEYARRLLIGWQPGPGLRRTSPLTVEFKDLEDGYFTFEFVVMTSRDIVPAITTEGLMGGIFAADAPAPSANFTEGTAPVTTE